MASATEKTRAEEVYAAAYAQTSETAGMPDRKITDGLPVTGQRILSLGSGNCADIWHLAGGNDLFALDGSPSAIEAASAHGIKGQVYDLEQRLPFDDGVFDLVVCKDLLEHLVAPERLLNEIGRVLKPSGRLIVGIPNHFYLPFRLRILFGGNLIWKSILHDHGTLYDEWNYMHVRFFTYGGLLRFLKTGGFVKEKGFWDFGTLAHYSNPDMFHEHMLLKFRDRPLTPKAGVYRYVIYPLWQVFNVIFPRPVRSAIVGLAPGLLCAGFYLRCRKA